MFKLPKLPQLQRIVQLATNWIKLMKIKRGNFGKIVYGVTLELIIVMKFFLLKREPLVPVLTPIFFFQGPSSVGLNPKFSNFKPFDSSLAIFFQIREPFGQVQKLFKNWVWFHVHMTFTPQC
jgi:hypothetical protein